MRTLGELDTQLTGKRLEQLLSAETKSAIAKHLGLEKAASKKEIGLYLAEICAAGATDFGMSKASEDVLAGLLGRASSVLAS